MKLTKEEIQHIDDYLQRSGITFWDIRIELLDHFIEAIEAKMTADSSLDFDEALLEVTVAFGNPVQERHLVNKDKSVVLFSGMFSNNKGFKELEAEKRKQYRKQYMHLLWKQLKENAVSIQFYADYIAFILMAYIVFQYYTKWVLLTTGIWLLVEIVKTLFVTGKHKTFAQDSLRGEMSSKIISVFFGVIINLFGCMFTMKSLQPKLLFWTILITIAFYPIMKAGLAIHKKIYKQFVAYYKLISA